MTAVADGEGAHEIGGEAAMVGGMRAERVAVAVGADTALVVGDEDVGIFLREPCGGGGGGGGEAEVDAGGVEVRDDAVEPVEGEDALGGVERLPAEDRERDQGDAGRAHKAHVIGPDGFGPLVGVVVAAVIQAFAAEGDGGDAGGGSHAWKVKDADRGRCWRLP